MTKPLYPVTIHNGHLVFNYGQQKIVLTARFAEQLAYDMLDVVSAIDAVDDIARMLEETYVPFVICENCGGSILNNETHDCPHCASGAEQL